MRIPIDAKLHSLPAPTTPVREARELYHTSLEGPRVSLVRVIGKRRVIEASLVRGVALCSSLLMQPS